LDTVAIVPLEDETDETPPWRIAAFQVTFAPDAGEARNPANPVRSGMTTVVDPFR
jgi:hypothetical protein